MKLSLKVLVLAAIVLIASYLGRRGWRDSTPPPAEELTPAADASPAPGLPLPVSTSLALPSPAPAESPAAIRDAIPNGNDYVAEVERNPHAIPPSVQIFAKAMGRRMEMAMTDEPAARKLMGEMKECVNDAQVPSIQQTCLIHAKKLGKRHPSLAGEAEAIESASSPELVESVKKLGL